MGIKFCISYCKCWFLTVNSGVVVWRRGVVVITTAQLHSTKSELKFCAGSNLARSMSEIRDGENLWQWSRLEIRLITFRLSTIPQKQFITIIIGLSIIKHLADQVIIRLTWQLINDIVRIHKNYLNILMVP